MIGIGFPIELFETVSQSARSIGELMTLNLLWVLLVGCGAFLMARRMRSPGTRIAVVAVSLCLAVPALKPQPWRAADHAPRVVKRTGHVQSVTCRNCHPGAHGTWRKSYHRTMTQLASPQTVRGIFDGETEYTTWGTRFRFEQRGDEFWVHIGTPEDTSGPNAGLLPHRVVMLTGSHHIQICWVTDGEDPTLKEVPMYYSIDQGRWIPKKDSVLSPPDMGPYVANWTARCSRCHSLAASPGYDARTGQYDLEIAEFGISCESCHGPGEEHARRHQNPVNRYLRHFDKQPDPSIVNPARCDPRTSTQICGRCHSAANDRDFTDYLQHGVRYTAGDDLDKFTSLLKYQRPANASDMAGGDPYENSRNVFWNDGTCRVGGDEYNAHIESPCYQQGKQIPGGRPTLTCLSCHSMHQKETDARPSLDWANDQLKPDHLGNQACVQCHDEPLFAARLSEHTHHGPESAGSLCYNCHMPHTTYALFTAMRSHRIDSPRALSSTQSDRPNACNLCHVDRTLQWTSEHLTSWYGAPEAELTADEQQIAASLLWLLRGDAVQRVFAAWHLGWQPAQQASGRGWQAALLAQLLDDPYSIVRWMAHRSLMSLPEFADFEYDFIGTKAQQTQARREALRISRQMSPQRDVETWSHLLRTPGGTIDQLRIDRLMGERDNRPLSIPE